MKKYLIVLLLLASLLSISIGCPQQARRDYSKLNLVEASGTITLDGRPLEKAQVFFIDDTTNTYSFALTDQSGNYKLSLDSRRSGVTPGKKTVTIWTAKGGIEFGEAFDEEQMAQLKEKVPGKYNTDSELTAIVLAPQEKSHQTFDFSLNTK
jgi:hypothetical protein